MPNTLTTIFTSTPSSLVVEAQHPNTLAWIPGTQLANGTWQVIHTGVTKTALGAVNPTVTGRLQSSINTTASVQATGPVLNNVLTTPTVGPSNATGTSTTTISLTVSSIANQGGYRFFTSDTLNGTYALLYQGASAAYLHTVASGATKYYKCQYVGNGVFYDDSLMSAVFSGTANATAAKVQVIAIGDSITYGAHATDITTQSWVPLIGSKFPAAWSPITRIGTPGEQANAFIGLHQSALQALFDSTATVIYVTIAYGANDLNAMLPAQFITNYTQLHTAVRALDPRIKTISYTIMNRVNSALLSGTVADFDTRRNTANTSIIANSGISDFIIDFSGQTLLAATAAPSNLDNFDDGTHPTTRGHALYANVILPALSVITSQALGLVAVPAAASTTLAPLAYVAFNRAVAITNGVKSTDSRATGATTAYDFLSWAQANRKIVVANGSAGIHVPFDSARVGAAMICLSAVPLIDGTTASTDTYGKGYASVYFTSGTNNVAVFQQATIGSPSTPRATDVSISVTTNAINFYQTDFNNPFYTITGPPPAELYVYSVLYHLDSNVINATIEGQGIVVTQAVGAAAVPEEFLAYSTLAAVAQNVSVSGTGASTKIVKLGGANWADGAPATRALQAGCRFKLGQIAASGQGQRVMGTTRTATVGTNLSTRYNELEYGWYLDDTNTNPTMGNLAGVPGAVNAPPVAGMLLEIFFSADGTRVDWLRNGTVVATLSPTGGVVFPQVPEVTFLLDSTAGVTGASIVGTNLINSGF